MTRNRQIVLKLILTIYYSFVFFYDTPKLIFVRLTESQNEKFFYKAFYQLQNAIQPSIFIHFFQLKFEKTYLELPKLFYMKLKVKVRPTEKLHFKLGFPN